MSGELQRNTGSTNILICHFSLISCHMGSVDTNKYKVYPVVTAAFSVMTAEIKVPFNEDSSSQSRDSAVELVVSITKQ